MTRRGIEFTLMQLQPGLWQWQFRIGQAVTTGETRTKLKGMAARRAQQRIDRELKSRATSVTNRSTTPACRMLPRPRRPREKRSVRLIRAYAIADFANRPVSAAPFSHAR